MSSTDDPLSEIVPAYNAQGWLPQCLDSIIGRTYRDLELIVVDDGSTYGTGDLCDAYAMCDSRVRVIHVTNGGPCHARKKGLELVGGSRLVSAPFQEGAVRYEAACHAFGWHRLV